MYKKFLLIVLCLSMCLMFFINIVYAEQRGDDKSYSPMFTCMRDASINLDIDSAGKATCTASLLTYSGYETKVDLELQQYKNSTWQTIKTWTSSSTSTFTSISQNYYVVSGNSYRLRGNYYAIQNGSVAESFVSYSDIENY